MCEIKSTGLRIGAIAILTFLTWYSHEPAKVAAGGTSCSQQNDKRAGQTSTANPANSWKTLVPLRSTRADVERMFGKAEIPNGGYHLYKFEKEKVFFTYTYGNCVTHDRGWNVAADNILEIEIIPQTPLLLAETGFDLKKFRQTESYHPRATIYENQEDGVTISTRILRVAEEVMSIKLQPSIRELEFACPK